MEILPASAVTDFTTQLTATLAENVGVIVGIIALGVAVAFVVRWFNKGTRRIKA